MKVTRRLALKSAGVMGIASALGCEGGDAAPGDGGLDASTLPREDASPPIGRDGGPAPTGPFRHGVASGDPLPDAVILWTRVSDASAAVEVEWEMSTDPALATIDASGTATAEPSRDFTVNVDAGGLEPATTYYYRFRLATGEVSPVGRTRTAPGDASEIRSLRFAVCSCSSYPHGYFHAYKNIAGRADLDAVIHLGDYIYEYGFGEYGSLRELDPPHETITLEDYRRRYAHYRLDGDLAEAHRQHPFVCIWDDHETADNSYRDGAENHEPEDEGSWEERKAAAIQAYAEWMPIRLADPTRIYRILRYGSLVDLVLLDTRIEGRTEQGEGAPEDRAIVSAEQEAFVADALSTSAARWKLLAQQVVFSPFTLFPNSDAWDGYPVQRARVLEAIAAVDDVIVLTGDIHMGFALEVVPDPKASPLAPVAVELVVPGVTSPGLVAGPIADSFARIIERDMPYAKHYDLVHKGYLVLDLDAERAHADYVILADPRAPYDASESVSASFTVATGTPALAPAPPLAVRAGAPPLAP